MSAAISTTEPITAIAEYTATAAALADLRHRCESVVFDVATKKGMDDARVTRRELVSLRTSLDEKRLELNKDDQDRISKRNAEAKRITAEIVKLEQPIDAQIKAEEARKEAEKQAKIDAELKRVANLQDRVAELRGNQSLSASAGSALIAEHIADLERISVDDTFEEFQVQAETTKVTGLARLKKLYSAAIAHEAEQERIKAERAELAKQREELARQELEQKAIRDAETAKLAAERAELERQQEALRKAQEPKPRVRLSARPSDTEMVSVLALHYRVHESKIVEWLLDMNLSNPELSAA